MYSSKGNKCTKCLLSEIQDVQNLAFTPLTKEHKVVLLSKVNTNPDVSMNFDDVNDETITGTNTIGTTINVDQLDYINGKNGNSLYLHDGGKVRMTGSQHSCWTNLELCTFGVTMFLWVKPVQLKISYVATTGSIFQRGFGFYFDNSGKIVALVTLDNGRYAAKSKSQLAVGIWAHIACVYEATSGISIYLNGILEKSFVEDDIWAQKVVTEVDWDAHIGVRDSEPYNDFPLDGYVDDFKYYYYTFEFIG